MTVTPFTAPNFRAKAATTRLHVGPHNIFTRNGLTLNDRLAVETYFIEDFTGFERADINLNDEQNPQDDGGTPYRSFRSMRNMTLEGFIQAGSYPALLDMGGALEDSLVDLIEMPMVIGVKPRTALFTNLHTDPGATSTDPYTGGGTAAISIVGGAVRATATGATAFGATNDVGVPPLGVRMPVIPTRTYSASAKLVGITAGRSARISIQWRDVTNGLISTSVGTASSTVGGTLTLNGIVAPALADRALMQVFTLNGAVGNILDTDEWMFGEGAVAPSFFMGGFGPALWNGEPNASTSTLYDSYYAQDDVYINCRPVDYTVAKTITQDDQTGLLKRKIMIALRATNPRYRSVALKHLTIVPTVTSISGRIYPRTYPLDYSHLLDPTGVPAAAGNQATAVNAGNWEARPLLRFTGPMTGVSLTNGANGHVLRLTHDVPAGDYIEVDVAKGTVVDSVGNKRASYRDTTSDWLELEGKRGSQTGSNLLSLGVASFSAGAQLDVWWEDTSL